MAIPWVFAQLSGGNHPASYLDDDFAYCLNSANTSFLSSGTGAVATDLQTRGRLVRYATDFGTKMVTSPGADINLAINAVNLAGGGTVIVPAGSYTIETTILQKSNVILDLRGVILTAKTGLNAPVIQNATSVASQTCTITRTNRTATATKTAHGYSNNNWVFINGANQLGYNGVHQIFNVTANTFDFYVEKTTVTPATGTINVYVAVESKLGIIGGEIVGNASNTTGSNYGIYYHGVENFRIDGTYVHDTYHTCVGIISGANGRLFDVTGNGAINTSHDGFLFGTTNAGPASSFSYAYNIELIGCRGDSNGQTGYEFVEGRMMRMVGCTARANGPGITVRGVGQLTITGCTAEENTNHGLELFLAEGASDITVTGNNFRYNGDAGIYLGNRDTANTSSRIALTGNNCSVNNQGTAPTAAYGIAVENTALCTIDQLTITDNVCNNNSRGISFGANGTVSNVLLADNISQGNAVNYFFDTSLQVSTTQSDIWLPFTPALKFGGASVGLTYGTQIGRFQKIGTTCRFQITLILTAKGSSVGEPSITGLPCTAKNLATYYAVGAPYTDVVTFGDGIQFFISPNGTAMNFRKIVSGGTNTIPTEADFANTSTLLITGSYETE